jgi:DNA-binding NtrC family response regulator
MNRVEADGLFFVAFLKDGVAVHRLVSDVTIRVGRSTECDIRLDSVALSRVHFAIRAGATPVIRDLGSVNGTRLGGVKLAPNVDTPVRLGTVIEAAGSFFVLRDRDPRASFDVPEATATAGSPDGALQPAVVVEDPAMARVWELVGLISRSSMPVIVTGETGAGKEIVACALHAQSPRARNPLVQINCAALPESLLESELFGFERGAFTGAAQSKAGLVESADRSTFFLDEIGEMPLAIQAKLLRVLESGEITRLGALRPRAVDVRFIAATNRDLPALVAEGGFRADLYYRLNGITIPVPPLRERVADIPKLANLFLSQGATRAKRPTPRLTDEAGALLQRHAWPGNVRELRNVIDRALTISPGDVIDADAILLDPVESAGMPSGISPDAAGNERATQPPLAPRERPPPRGRLVRRDPATECAMIVKALEDAGGNQGRAAELLGVSRRTLINRLEEYGLSRPRKR